jgi:hypothetical protein
MVGEKGLGEPSGPPSAEPAALIAMIFKTIRKTFCVKTMRLDFFL